MKAAGILIALSTAGMGYTGIRLVTNEPTVTPLPRGNLEPVVRSGKRDASDPVLVSSGRSSAEQIGLAIAWADVRDPEKIKKRLNKLHLLPSGAKDAAFSLLLLNWVQVDPPSACEWCELNKESLSEALAEWSKNDPAAAISYAKTMTHESRRTSAYSTILDTVAGSDFDQAFAMIAEISSDFGSYSLRDAAKKLADFDPHRLISRAENQPPEIRKVLREAAVIAMFRSDPADALAWWVGQPDKEALSKAAFWALPSSHWQDAIAIYHAAGAGQGVSFKDFRSLGWAYRDPSSYLAIFGSPNDLGIDHEQALHQAAIGVAAEDPLAALRWYQSQAEKNSDLSFELSKIWKLLDTPDAQAALSELGEVEDLAVPPREQHRTDPATASEYFDRTRETGQEVGLDWIGDLPYSEIERFGTEFSTLPEREQSRIVPNLVDHLDGFSPSTASDLLAIDGIWDPTEKTQRTADLATTWASADPLSASSWAANLPDSSLRELAVSKVALQWKRYDPEAASSWAQELPDGAARAAALEALDE